MNLSNLIGKKIEDASSILDKQGYNYIIEKTVGYKDEDILNEEYIIRALDENGVITLTTGLFKTNI